MWAAHVGIFFFLFLLWAKLPTYRTDIWGYTVSAIMKRSHLLMCMPLLQFSSFFFPFISSFVFVRMKMLLIKFLKV